MGSETMKPGLRAATGNDEEFLERLFRDVRAPEFLVAGLPQNVVDNLLAMQRKAQVASYRNQFPEAQDQIILLEGEPVGRLLVSTLPTGIHLVDIALLGSVRGRGFGTLLLGDLCARAAVLAVPLRLSVRPGNRAQGLYKRLKFAVTSQSEANIEMCWTTAAVALPESPAKKTSAPSVTDALPRADDEANASFFERLVGQSVAARALSWPAGSDTTYICVDAVRPLPGNLSVQLSDRESNFTVDFHSALDRVLPNETVEWTLQNGMSIVLFVTPLGPHEGVMRYEAIFNRITG
jgi:ribosomal protein S18 acetylase RimI-like enzyme